MSILQKNLEALRASAPGVAELVARQAPPEGFESVTGTDGTPTFRRILTTPEGTKRLEWLGGTSMPRASAEALVSNLDASGGGSTGAQNGLGLSIGTGFEWQAFIARLLPAQALYVYEPTALLRLALDTCDLAELIASKKLVLLTGTPEQASGHLVQWLTANLGMEPPVVLHPLPTLSSPERRNALLSVGEAIVRQAMTHRQAQVAGLMSRVLEAAAAQEGSSRPATPFALTLTPRYPEERPLHEEIHRNGWQSLTIDRHVTASLALRLERLATLLERGPVRIVSDLFRESLGCVPPPPAKVSVETWIPPVAWARTPASWSRLPAELSPDDRIVLHAQEHREHLLARGLPASQIDLRHLALRGKPAPVDSMSMRYRVALVAELPSITPEALQLVLPTHQAIYAAARNLLAQDYLTAHGGSVPDLLRRALARAGVSGAQAADPALREPMLQLIRDMLLPVVPPMTLAEALAAQGVALTLLGDWPDWQTAAGQNVRRIPLTAEDAPRWHEVALLVHLAPTGIVPPVLGDAIAKGVAIVSPEHSTDAWPGSLAQLLRPDTEYLRPRPNQLFAAIKRLLADAGQRQKFASASAARLQTQ